MFHLFAGIQLVPDIISLGFNKEIIVSKFEDYELAEGAVSIVDHIPARRNMFGTIYAKQYDQLPYRTDVDFFIDVYKNDKNLIEVCADRQNYAIILCKFIKMFFPNKSAQSAYMEYKLSLDKFYVDYVYNRNVTIHRFTYPIDSIREHFEMYDQQTFTELFENTIITGDADKIARLREVVRSQLSTEYHIASMLNGDTRFDELLDKRIKNTILSVLASSVQEVNPFVTYNIYTGLYQFTNTADQDIKQCINKLPVADLLNCVDVFEPSSTEQYDRYNAEYKRLADFLIKCQDFGWDKVDMDYALKCIKYLDSNYHIKDVIVDLLAEHDVKIFLFSEIKNINPLLLFYIFDLYQKQDEGLADYVID